MMNADLLSRMYTPPKSRASLVLFRATEPSDEMNLPAESFDWSALVEKLPKTILIPCKHENLMSARAAKSVAEALIPLLGN